MFEEKHEVVILCAFAFEFVFLSNIVLLRLFVPVLPLGLVSSLRTAPTLWIGHVFESVMVGAFLEL